MPQVWQPRYRDLRTIKQRSTSVRGVFGHCLIVAAVSWALQEAAPVPMEPREPPVRCLPWAPFSPPAFHASDTETSVLFRMAFSPWLLRFEPLASFELLTGRTMRST